MHSHCLRSRAFANRISSWTSELLLPHLCRAGILSMPEDNSSTHSTARAPFIKDSLQSDRNTDKKGRERGRRFPEIASSVDSCYVQTSLPFPGGALFSLLPSERRQENASIGACAGDFLPDKRCTCHHHVRVNYGRKGSKHHMHA